MRRFWSIAVLTLILAGYAFASDRWIVEDGKADGGTFTNTTLPTHVFSQSDSKPGTILESANCTSNTCTRDLPFSDMEGIHLGNVSSYITTVCVDAGTFVDGGQLDFLVRDPEGFTDAGNAWSLAESLTITAPNNSVCFNTGVRKNAFRAPGYRMLPRANGLKVSTSAPTLTISTRACLKASAGGCGE